VFTGAELGVGEVAVVGEPRVVGMFDANEHAVP
jgi:hypothetical protein